MLKNILRAWSSHTPVTRTQAWWQRWAVAARVGGSEGRWWRVGDNARRRGGGSEERWQRGGGSEAVAARQWLRDRGSERRCGSERRRGGGSEAMAGRGGGCETVAARRWQRGRGSETVAARLWLRDGGCEIVAARRWQRDHDIETVAARLWQRDRGCEAVAARPWQQDGCSETSDDGSEAVAARRRSDTAASEGWTGSAGLISRTPEHPGRPRRNSCRQPCPLEMLAVGGGIRSLKRLFSFFQRSVVPPRADCACASRSAGGL